MVNLNIRVKLFAVPESGERKRNLTTLVLVKRAAVKRSRFRQKISESSQNPLKWSCTAGNTRQGRSSRQQLPSQSNGGSLHFMKTWQKMHTFNCRLTSPGAKAQVADVRLMIPRSECSGSSLLIIAPCISPRS